MKRNNHWAHLCSYTCFIAWNIFSAEIEFRETKWNRNMHAGNNILILWKTGKADCWLMDANITWIVMFTTVANMILITSACLDFKQYQEAKGQTESTISLYSVKYYFLSTLKDIIQMSSFCLFCLLCLALWLFKHLMWYLTVVSEKAAHHRHNNGHIGRWQVIDVHVYINR